MSGFAEAFAPAEAEYRRRVMHSTWGHLAPDLRRVYPGTIVFIHGDYRDVAIVTADFPGLSDSPWLYEQLHEFIHSRKTECGNIYRFTGSYMMFKNGRGRFSGKVVRIKLTKGK